MKIRVRDQQLPLSDKTKKFKPLRLKNRILKWILGASLLANSVFIYIIIKS